MRVVIYTIYIVASMLYYYGYIEDNELYKKIGLLSLMPCLAIHYFTNTKKALTPYVLALIFAFLGDIAFLINPDNLAREALTIGSYIIMNALMTFIILEKIEFKGVKRSFIISSILGIVFLVFNYLVFKQSEKIVLASAVYFVSLAILCASSISFYLKKKSKVSIYFLLASITHIFASFAKGYEYMYNNSSSVIVFLLFYGICNYFYVNAAIMVSENKSVE